MLRKSQSAIEFVIMIGFVLMFFSVFLLIIQENTANKLEEKNRLIVNELAAEIQDEVNLALEASDGYLREFSIPEKVANRDYDVSLAEGFVYLNTTDGKYALALPIPEVNGTIQNGTNMIRKENGAILLNQ
jgi:hypothetical protein